MRGRFARVVARVTIIHLALLLGYMLLSGWSWFFRRKQETVIPLEFVVEVPATEADEPAPVETPLPVPPAPQPPPVPTPAPVQTVKPPKPKPKPKPKITPSTNLVRRAKSVPSRSPLSPEEIRRLLLQGAAPSDHTNIPDEDGRGFEQVRRALYGSWIPPSGAEAGDAEAVAQIRLDANATVVGRRLTRSSGNAVFDASVLRALDSVVRIEGLDANFVRRHREIEIRFKVE